MNHQFTFDSAIFIRKYVLNSKNHYVLIMRDNDVPCAYTSDFHISYGARSYTIVALTFFSFMIMLDTPHFLKF